LDGRTFMSIVRREITPQQAFFQKEVQIEGDMTIALKMNVLVNYM
jgi:putative sterol carrier protein